MKLLTTLIAIALLPGCSHIASKDFVQGGIRIAPPVQKSQFGGMEDGGTEFGTLTDKTGRIVKVYIDHRIGTKTPGAIYLRDYPGKPKSVRVKNEPEFRQKLGF